MFPLAKELTAEIEEIKRQQLLSEDYRKALSVLEGKPTDPAANLAAGRHLCFIKGNWDRGVPMLALGSDAALKAVGIKDLRGADSADEQAAIGDAWWDLAETKQGQERDTLRLRAGFWYRQAFGHPRETGGRLALTAGGDQLVRLWNMPGRVELARYAGHSGHVYAAIFSPDGRRICAARRNLKRLSRRARKLLTVENDDKTYTPADLLPICRATGIPLVYDVHHHRCNPDGLSVEEATEQAIGTWDRKPLFHISSPIDGWKGPKPGRHHDFIDLTDFPNCWLNLDVTVEVEAKAKEVAVLKLQAELERRGRPRKSRT